MGKSESTPKMHHILILPSSSIHFSPFSLAYCCCGGGSREEGGAEERERGVPPGRTNRGRGVMGKRIWTWAKEWAGWMALGLIWFRPLLKFFFSLQNFLILHLTYIQYCFCLPVTVKGSRKGTMIPGDLSVSAKNSV